MNIEKLKYYSYIAIYGLQPIVPLFKKDNYWYHYDETGDIHGPYENFSIVTTKFCCYCEYLEADC